MDQENEMDPMEEQDSMPSPANEPEEAAGAAAAPETGLTVPGPQVESEPSMPVGDLEPDGAVETAANQSEVQPVDGEPLPDGGMGPGESTLDVPAASEDVAPESEGKPSGSEAQWFVVHCYSGYENKVRHNLEQRIETMGMRDKIYDVVIPTQEEVEVKDGKRRVVERHVFPGYVLVNMVLSDESWFVVRNTPGVTGFVGMGNDPTPLRPEEVAQILKRMEAEAPHIKVSFKMGERVRIIDGPFNDFRGTVAEIDADRSKVRVMVNFFGRETPVELDFLQVEKS